MRGCGGHFENIFLKWISEKKSIAARNDAESE